MAASVTYLYAIGSSDGPIKFGISMNPWKRAAQIQTASPFKVALISACPCNSREEALLDEKWLHDYYAQKGKLLFGEWFDVSAVQAVEAVRDAVGFGNHFRGRAQAEGVS